MATTIKDIAQRVGKSVTTVSRALNDYNDISPQTKERVRQAAIEMGYRPSVLAQRLQKQRTDTIGFVLPTFGPRFSDPFFSEFLAGIGNRATQLGFDLLVSTRTPGEEELSAYRNYVQERRVDGFIIVRTRKKDDRIDYLKSANYPFVAFGRVKENFDYPFVDEDSEFGMGLVVEYLIRLGHRKFGVIAPPMNLMFSSYRLKGIRMKIEEAGLALDENLVATSDLTQRGGYIQAQILLGVPDPPTAIVACNDLMAFGAMSAAQEKGMIVGKDVSITGFDDIPMAEHSHPPLTTLHQPIYKIGGMLSEMLVKLVLNEDLKKRQVILHPSLIIRQSCGPPPQN